MSEPIPTFDHLSVYDPAVSSTSAIASEFMMLNDKEEINLIRRYRQARAQGMMLMIDADAGTLRMCGRAEQLRRR